MKNMKILIIEDDDQDIKIMTRFLNKAGYKDILFTHRGEEGIERTKSERPDLLIIDTKLLGMDGFEVCRQIKKVERLDTKVIIITGCIDAVDAVKAKHMGADDYCVKTADYAPLIEAVKNVMGRE